MLTQTPCFTREEPTQFVDGPIEGIIATRLTHHEDDRGWLVEVFRSDELPEELFPAMTYVSQTLPGTTRGPHEHSEQTDLFAFLGDGRWVIWLWDVRRDSPTWGYRQRIDVQAGQYLRLLVPPGVVHAYRNVGNHPACVLNAANRLYAGENRESEIDEIRHEQRVDSPFLLDD